nr:hypothetical protein Q903MT_gene5942 [Picea sitchensis]
MLVHQDSKLMKRLPLPLLLLLLLLENMKLGE